VIKHKGSELMLKEMQVIK